MGIKKEYKDYTKLEKINIVLSLWLAAVFIIYMLTAWTMDSFSVVQIIVLITVLVFCIIEIIIIKKQALKFFPLSGYSYQTYYFLIVLAYIFIFFVIGIIILYDPKSQWAYLFPFLFSVLGSIVLKKYFPKYLMPLSFLCPFCPQAILFETNWKCQNCGNVNEDSSIFSKCKKCGNKLTSIKCPNCKDNIDFNKEYKRVE